MPDKRRDNSHIPFDILLCLAVAAKPKRKASLTDVPFAVTEAELLAKYSSEEWISFYNSYVQKYLMKELDVQPCIHILDCTKILVNLDNGNYENSSVVKIDGEALRGYKPGILRGVLDDSGIVEEAVFGTLRIHDMEQCRQMLRDTPCFHGNDILIDDRGFLSWDMMD